MIKNLINKLEQIRNVEVEVKPFMMFSDDSKLGKSHTAFIVNHLYNVITTDRMRFFVCNRRGEY